MALARLLNTLSLGEAARFKIDYLALSRGQVEEWVTSMLRLEDSQVISLSWEVNYRSHKRAPKVRLVIQCTGQVTAQDVWCWIDHLTAFLQEGQLSKRLCLGFWLAHTDRSCYGGYWTSTLTLESQVKPVPQRHQALWSTPS